MKHHIIHSKSVRWRARLWHRHCSQMYWDCDCGTVKWDCGCTISKGPTKFVC